MYLYCRQRQQVGSQEHRGHQSSGARGKVIFFLLYLSCICSVDKDNRWGRYYFCFPVFVDVFVLAFVVMLTHMCGTVDVSIIDEKRVASSMTII